MTRYDGAMRLNDGAMRYNDGAIDDGWMSDEYDNAMRRSDSAMRRSDATGDDRFRGKIVSYLILICCSVSALVTHLITHRQRISKTSRGCIIYDRSVQASVP